MVPAEIWTYETNDSTGWLVLFGIALFPDSPAKVIAQRIGLWSEADGDDVPGIVRQAITRLRAGGAIESETGGTRRIALPRKDWPKEIITPCDVPADLLALRVPSHVKRMLLGAWSFASHVDIERWERESITVTATHRQIAERTGQTAPAVEAQARDTRRGYPGLIVRDGRSLTLAARRSLAINAVRGAAVPRTRPRTSDHLVRVRASPMTLSAYEAERSEALQRDRDAIMIITTQQFGQAAKDWRRLARIAGDDVGSRRFSLSGRWEFEAEDDAAGEVVSVVIAPARDYRALDYAVERQILVELYRRYDGDLAAVGRTLLGPGVGRRRRVQQRLNRLGLTVGDLDRALAASREAE